MSQKAGIKVFAPAVVGNLGIGFDILGVAIDGMGDTLKIRESSKKGVSIAGIHGDKGILPRDETNTALFAAKQVTLMANLEDCAIEIELFKGMPFNSGLGSSAASAVAGAYGMNLYLEEPLNEKQVLECAAKAEQLATKTLILDNVAPCLIGGMVLIRDNETLDYCKLPIPLGLSLLLITPKIRVSTIDSRSKLKETITLAQHIKQSGNLASFVSALYKSDFNLISRSLEDHIIEEQRAVDIPGFYALKEKALEAGALGFSISGSGPSMFALCNNSLVGENIGNLAKAIYRELKLEIGLHYSPINQKGAYKF